MSRVEPGDRTRVLLLVDRVGAGAGGGERAASALAGRLPAEGFEVTLCATRTVDEPDRSALERAGVELVELRRRGRLDAAPFAKLIRLIRKRRFQVLHAHKFGSNVWGTLIGRLTRVPVVIAHEQTWNYDRRLRRAIDFVIGRLATAFLSVSSADRERMIELERVPRAKTMVVPNPLAPRPGGGARDCADIRGEIGLEPGAELIGTAAVLRRQKALGVLIGAFGELAATRPSLHLAIAGDGGELPHLREAASATGHEDRIHFLGMREDVAGLLGELDVAVMSSDYEGAPLFLVECMTHGAPIVSTAVGGIPDMIGDGVHGLLVPPRDEAALAAAIGRMLDDPELRERLSAAARVRARDFSIESVAARFAGVYAGLLAGRALPELERG